MNKKLFDLLYIVLILGVIGFCICMGYFLITQGSKCMADPLKYQQEKYGNDYKCFCYSMNPYGAVGFGEK